MTSLLVGLLTSFLLSYQTAQAGSFKFEDIEIALGAQYSSLFQKRGIITYEGHQITPIYSVRLGNPHLLLAGSSLYYTRPLFAENDLLRLRLNVDSTGDEPLYYTEEKEEDRIRREKTSELDLFYEIRSEQGSHVRILHSQDLGAHGGFYNELYAHLALINLFTAKNDKILIQPGVFASIGAGNEPHNDYLYGEGPASNYQITNIQYGLSVTSPGVIDPFWPTFKISRFEILGDRNKSASYVQETQGWQVELLFAFRVF